MHCPFEMNFYVSLFNANDVMCKMCRFLCICFTINKNQKLLHGGLLLLLSKNVWGLANFRNFMTKRIINAKTLWQPRVHSFCKVETQGKMLVHLQGSTVRLLTHVLCKPTHFFFHLFIATMSYSLQTSFISVMEGWADKFHAWGIPTRSPSRSNSR